MGFSRQECWSGLPFPSPGDLPDPGINPGLLHCRQSLYLLSHQGRPYPPYIAWHLVCPVPVSFHWHALLCSVTFSFLSPSCGYQTEMPSAEVRKSAFSHMRMLWNALSFGWIKDGWTLGCESMETKKGLRLWGLGKVEITQVSVHISHCVLDRDALQIPQIKKNDDDDNTTLGCFVDEIKQCYVD